MKFHLGSYKHYPKWNAYLKGTNFRGYLISQVKKSYISRVLIFANDRLHYVYVYEVLIFTNLDLFCWWLMASRCRLAWFKVGCSDCNDKWKCYQPPTLNSIWKAAKWTLHQTKEGRNLSGFLFSSEWRREASRGKLEEAEKTTGEETSEIKEHLGYVAKPKIKKGWRK